MLMEKIKWGKVMVSNGGCCFRKEGREGLPDKVIPEQGSGQNGDGKGNKTYGYWGRMFQTQGSEGTKPLR